MVFNPRAAVILVVFGTFVALAAATRGPWFHVAEAVTTVAILVGIAGLLRAKA